MTLLSVYNIHGLQMVNAIVFGLLCVVWTKSNWVNFFIKAFFLLLMVLSILAFYSTPA